MANLYSDVYLKHKIGDCILNRYKILKKIEISDIGPIYITSELNSNKCFICIEMAILENRNKLLDRFKINVLKYKESPNSDLYHLDYLEEVKEQSVCPVCGETFIGEELSPCHMQKPLIINKRCYFFVACQGQKENIETYHQNKLTEWCMDDCKNEIPLCRRFISNLVSQSDEQKTIPYITDNVSLLQQKETDSAALTVQEAEKIIKDDTQQNDCHCPYYHDARCVWNIKDASTDKDVIKISVEGAPECFEKGKKNELLYEINHKGTIVSKNNMQYLEPSCENCPYISRNDNKYTNTFTASGIGGEAPSSSSDTMTAGPGRQRTLVEGTVLSVDPPYEEPPDRDFAKFGLGLIASLILIPVTIIAFVIYLLLSIPLKIVRLNGLIAPLNPLGLFGLLAFLGIGSGRNDYRVPVRNFRIRDQQGNEYQVRMKGHLVVGNIMPADRVSIWGKWKRGTFIFKRAYNYRIRSEVKIRQLSIWPKIILGIISLSVIAGLFFYYYKVVL
jgi:hypothetical protein